MSIETQTPQSHKEFDPSEENPFVSQAGRIAQESMFEIPEPVETDLETAGREAQEMSDAGAANRFAHAVNENDALLAPALRNVNTTKKTALAAGTILAAGAALVAGGTGVGAEIVDAFDGPNFSPETQTYVVQPGDGLQNAAESIIGSDTIDIRDAIQHISVDPANIDVLSDGLQPGEVLIVPDHIEE